jgi:hypothetical protein
MKGDSLEARLVDVGALVAAAAGRGFEELVGPVGLARRAPADAAHGAVAAAAHRRGRAHAVHLQTFV